MRSEFTTVRLGDLCEIIMGQSPKSEFYNTDGMGLPFLQGNRTFGDKYPTFDTYTTSVTKVAEASDVIMSVRAPVGDVNITPVKLCLGRGVCALRHKNGAQEFLYYLMRYYSNELINRESGTVFGSVNRDDIFNLEVSVPPLKEQLVIGHVLSTIDDKIAINNAINQHLEQIAQAIFKSWFVDFEPSKPITDFVEVLGGGTPKTGIPEYWNGVIPFFTPKDVSGVYTLTTEKTLTAEGLRNCNSRLFPTNTVFVTARGTVGKLTLAGCPMAMNQSCYALIGKEGYGQYYVYHLTQYVVENLKHKASGAVFDAIVTRDFETELVPNISPDEVRLFEDKVAPLYEAILNYSQENARLAALRDTLLPRLMSGELSVADLEDIT